MLDDSKKNWLWCVLLFFCFMHNPSSQTSALETVGQRFPVRFVFFSFIGLLLMYDVKVYLENAFFLLRTL